MAQIYEIVLKNQQLSTEDNIITEEQMPDGTSNFSGFSGASTITTLRKIKPNMITNPKLKIGGGNRTGVEHNRYQRVITTIGNRFTGGLYEKGMRYGSAFRGLATVGSTVGGTILAQGAFKLIDNFLVKPLHRQALERNDKDILRIRVGDMTIPTNYEMTVNFWTGRRKYKENL